MKKRVHAFYSGRVQGVGFRFAARDIAVNLKVNGWVRNLNDGRVEMTAEAEEETLKELLKKIKKSFEGYISAEEIEWANAAGENKRFEIIK